MDLQELRNTVVPRDPEPLNHLLAQMAAEEALSKRRPTRLDTLAILSPAHEQLLLSINDTPCLNVTERGKSLGWNTDRFQRIKKELLASNFIREETVSSGVGNPSKYLLLTKGGEAYLKSRGTRINPIHGGIGHHCLILKLREAYRAKGYKSFMDRKIGDYWPDLWCEGKDKGIVEVILSSHINEDLKKISKLAPMVDWIHLYFENRNTLDHYHYQFRMELRPETFNKLQFFLIDSLAS